MEIFKMKPRRLFLLLIIPLLFHCASSPLAKYGASARSWEADIRQFETMDRNEADPDESILFVGSSSIRLWSQIREDMAPYPVIQRGFGGSKLSDVAWFADRIIYPHRFRALVLFVANDITGSPDDKSPGETATLFRHLVKTVRKNFRSEPVFFIEITPTNSRWSAWPRISEANRLIAETCGREPGCYFIRTSKFFLGTGGRPNDALFLDDRLHLNREGYKLWAKLIKEALDSELPPMKR
jgi:hypothetical protein